MIVHLKTNNLSLCLNHEHLKSVLASVSKNFIKIEQELTGIMFSKIVVLYEIYSKKSFCPNTFAQRLYVLLSDN
jgi:hypothetical protein